MLIKKKKREEEERNLGERRYSPARFEYEWHC